MTDPTASKAAFERAVTGAMEQALTHYPAEPVDALLTALARAIQARNAGCALDPADTLRWTEALDEMLTEGIEPDLDSHDFLVGCTDTDAQLKRTRG